MRGVWDYESRDNVEDSDTVFFTLADAQHFKYEGQEWFIWSNLEHLHETTAAMQRVMIAPFWSEKAGQDALDVINNALPFMYDQAHPAAGRISLKSVMQQDRPVPEVDKRDQRVVNLDTEIENAPTVYLPGNHETSLPTGPQDVSGSWEPRPLSAHPERQIVVTGADGAGVFHDHDGSTHPVQLDEHGNYQFVDESTPTSPNIDVTMGDHHVGLIVNDQGEQQVVHVNENGEYHPVASIQAPETVAGALNTMEQQLMALGDIATGGGSEIVLNHDAVVENISDDGVRSLADRLRELGVMSLPNGMQVEQHVVDDTDENFDPDNPEVIDPFLEDELFPDDDDIDAEFALDPPDPDYDD